MSSLLRNLCRTTALILFLSLKEHGLVLVNPALVLNLTLYLLGANHSPHDRTNAPHVKEHILANKSLAESTFLVPDSNCHVFLRGDVRLVLGHSQCVALVQMDLLVVFCLAQEKLRLLTKFNLDNYSCLVLFSRLTRPLDQILAHFVAVVFENSHAVHAVPNHPKQKHHKHQ